MALRASSSGGPPGVPPLGIALGVVTFLALGALLWLGRGGVDEAPAPQPVSEPPAVFTGVQTVEFQFHGKGRLQRRFVGPGELDSVARCLERTVEVGPEATVSHPIAQRTVLVLIGDETGIRNFELFTDVHLKGNGGRYYENPCLDEIARTYVR